MDLTREAGVESCSVSGIEEREFTAGDTEGHRDVFFGCSVGGTLVRFSVGGWCMSHFCSGRFLSKGWMSQEMEIFWVGAVEKWRCDRPSSTRDTSEISVEDRGESCAPDLRTL
jgi:hypothetical protein